MGFTFHPELMIENLPLHNTGESDEGANRRLRSLVLDEDDNFRSGCFTSQQDQILVVLKPFIMKKTYILNFRLHKSTNDYQEAMKLVDKQYLKIIEVNPNQ